MSGFHLVRVDGGGGGGPIHLPPGETVLGRGPLLAVSDKRVSRRHGLLENLDGQLRLKPIHLNPCFVQSSLADSPRPLQRGSWFSLHDGGFFSLLPGQFVYKVVAVGGEDRTPRNSQMFEEEELPVSPEPDVDPRPPVGHPPTPSEPAPAALSTPEEAAIGRLNEADGAQPAEEEGDRRPVTPVTKRRVLPAWMMAAAETHRPSSSSSSSPKAAKRSTAPSTSAKGAAAKQAPPPSTSSPEGAGLSEEEDRPKKKRRKCSDEERTTSQSKTDVPPQQPSDRRASQSRSSEMSDESDGVAVETGEAEGGGETATADRDAGNNRRRQTKRAEPVAANSGAVSGPRLRTPCPYGKSCYRKNPIHFQECSHPGDTDFEDEEEEDEDEEETDRPECPYGTDCYRKNPLHRKEYKHTKKPARAARTVPRTGDGDDDSGDDDSFINDDSDAAGEDSDYVPPVSDDSDKEDLKGLQKEAKAFTKRKK